MRELWAPSPLLELLWKAWPLRSSADGWLLLANPAGFPASTQCLLLTEESLWNQVALCPGAPQSLGVPRPALVCDDLDSGKEPDLGVGKDTSPLQLLRHMLGLCGIWRKYSAVVIRKWQGRSCHSMHACQCGLAHLPRFGLACLVSPVS